MPASPPAEAGLKDHLKKHQRRWMTINPDSRVKSRNSASEHTAIPFRPFPVATRDGWGVRDMAWVSKGNGRTHWLKMSCRTRAKPRCLASHIGEGRPSGTGGLPGSSPALS
ncbi:hypothetical protein SKAU_G00036280 [Synaphobranchus kaupii]|uniref:Uncharacterized protein n=1 Tax=Synaphobranchus kaupii TaxID=118154 RepID=A0A9Q1GEU6_SYNKA|nr:hypothetical protein SKAU_G00036280 [Synaphobranchus kaupii]